MSKFPYVIGEYETLEKLHEGYSIARYGDGEFKVAAGGDCVSQIRNPKLAADLRDIVKKGSTDKLLVAIPPLNYVHIFPEGKKRDFWQKQILITQRYLAHDKQYYSSFITRSDNAPWVDTERFWNSLVDLWRGKRVTLVLGSERSLCERNMQDAEHVDYVWAARRDAYTEIDAIEDQIRRAGNKTVILCLGCTATVLAARLAGEFQALDLGHMGLKGMFKKGRGLE